MGQNAGSSWQQSGHLRGKLNKVRQQANSGPVAVAYALILGHLCGERGQGLFETMWSVLLDTPPGELRAQAATASQQGWLEYRHSGDVTDVSFRRFLRDWQPSEAT
jgi:hypothetical protein